MRIERKFIAAGGVSLLAMAWSWAPAAAAGKPSTLPKVFLVEPSTVNPRLQPNIMIVGQNFTPATRVQVGGEATRTIDATDGNHLLVKLPEDLPQGSYAIEVSNEAGTTRADDQLVVDPSDPGRDRTTILVGVGFLALLVLVMRMARTPGLS